MARKISLTQAVQTSAPRKTAEEQLEDLGLLTPKNEKGIRTKKPATSADEGLADPPPPLGEFVPDLLVKNIFPSPFNPRTEFDEAELQELAASVRRHGLLEPLVTRSIPGKPRGVVELVAGERRWRAAQLAGVERVPARIFTIDDATALEWCLVENLQRKDLSPLDEALGFQRAMNELGWTADQLAEKTKKSKSTIYGALKLLSVPQALLKAMKAGDVPIEVCKLVGRLPNVESRQKLTDDILGDLHWSPPTYKSIREQIEREFMVELKGAKFNQADKDLVPNCGPCTTCPLRTGNNRALYPDGRGDMCTNPPCFRAKTIAAGQRQLEQARVAGRPVLDGREDLFYEHGGLKSNRGFEDVSRTCHEDPKMRSFEQALGKEAIEKVKVLAMDNEGVVHELVPAKVLQDLVKKAFPKAERRSSSYSAPHRDTFGEKVEAETRRRLQAAAAAKAESMSYSILGAAPAFFSPLVRCLLEEFWADIISRVASRRGVDGREGLCGLTESGNHRDLLALLVELAVCRGTSFGESSQKLKPLLAALGVEPKKIEAEVRKELKQSRK